MLHISFLLCPCLAPPPPPQPTRPPLTRSSHATDLLNRLESRPLFALREDFLLFPFRATFRVCATEIPAANMSAPQDNHHDGEELADAMGNMIIGEERLGPDGEALPKTDEEYAESQLTLRAIVSSKEAGVIIGKGGKNVADLRDETGVKAGVSKVVQGVHDRVLTISGGCEAISKAYAIVAKALLEGAPQMGMGGVVANNGSHCKSLTR